MSNIRMPGKPRPNSYCHATPDHSGAQVDLKHVFREVPKNPNYDGQSTAPT